jgi:cation diffusion facilitator CzcD-associated flavoprotein CzcO/pimeloyl-ACP methyl ester carboxylesterase
MAILEARESSGGTWDLFRYPGVRSDSDMFTLGYPFRPWETSTSIAPGASILQYVRETASAYDVDRLIRYGHRVVRADWSSATSLWTVEVVRGAEAPVTFTTSFLFICSGYYRYDEGYSPTFPGQDSFTGEIIHPQHWPADFDPTGKRIVVIGSGATAVTLVPALAAAAEHVTMLQRSPGYMAVLPDTDDGFDTLVSRHVPRRLAGVVSRWKGIARALLSYQISRRSPEKMKSILRHQVTKRLPEGYDVEKHFQPKYNPWDERLCIVPNGDLFKAIRSGRADVATDTIETLTPAGIRLASGAELAADVVVTATGLNLLLFGGMALSVDGVPVDPATKVTYQGMMLADVPNLAFAIGYTNASWTLKIDLVVHYVARILRHLDRSGHTTVTPVAPPGVGELRPLIDLTSGYIRRGIDQMPKQGAHAPWRLHQNYPRDVRMFRLSRLHGNGLLFSGLAAQWTRRSGSFKEPPHVGGLVSADPVLAAPRSIAVDGRPVCYRDTGSGSTVLLLHGIGRSLADWDGQHRLLGAGHRVISVDLAGFGGSTALRGRHTLDALAAWVSRFMDALDAEEELGAVDVVGNSLGGAVAMRLSVLRPEKVRRLVLINSAGFGATVTPALRLIAVPGLGRMLLRPAPKAAYRTERALFVNRSFVSQERIAASLARGSQRSAMRAFREVARDLGTFRGIRPRWRSRLIAEVAAAGKPVLILWGDSDLILPAGHLDEARRLLPAAQTHLFEQTGHMPHIERARETAGLIREFLH